MFHKWTYITHIIPEFGTFICVGSLGRIYPFSLMYSILLYNCSTLTYSAIGECFYFGCNNEITYFITLLSLSLLSSKFLKGVKINVLANLDCCNMTLQYEKIE